MATIATRKYVSPVSGTFEENSSNYYHAARRRGREHSGSDWRAKTGTPAVAAIGGTVVYVGTPKTKGHGFGAKGNYINFVDVLGDDGYIHRYAPHAGITVQVGQRVEQGDQVGIVGPASLNGTGRPHLHYEVMKPGTPAFEAAKQGQFGQTSFYGRGEAQTLDQRQLFSLGPGVEVAAGQPFGETQIASDHPVADSIATRPFSVATEVAAQQASPAALARMTAVVLAEARGEGPDGMAAVASVIRNRAAEKGVDVGTLLKTQADQFAPPMMGGFSQQEYQQAQQIAKGVLAGSIPDPTDGATYFANPKNANPSSLAKITATADPVATIGNHVFYKVPGQAAPATAVATADLGTPIVSGYNAVGGNDDLAQIASSVPVEPARQTDVARAVPVSATPADSSERFGNLVSSVLSGDKTGAEKTARYVAPRTMATVQPLPHPGQESSGFTQEVVPSGVQHIKTGPSYSAPAEKPTTYTPTWTSDDTLTPTKDPLQVVNAVDTAQKNLNMATAKPSEYVSGSAFKEAAPVSSIDYAFGRPDTADIPTIDIAKPAAVDAPIEADPAATEETVPVKTTAPVKMATTVPTKGWGQRIYQKIAQPITSTDKRFWSGPMTQPNFTHGSGGATMAYQRDTGRTTTDVTGNKVNVGVYTDNNGNQHEYTWTKSGAP